MNLLITRHDKIGDFVVTLPLFKACKIIFSFVSMISKLLSIFKTYFLSSLLKSKDNTSKKVNLEIQDSSK
jgi:hypothetical protein